MNLVRSLTAIALISLSGLAAAAPSYSTHHERIEVRHDNRQIAHDRFAIEHARHELRRAERNHDYRRAAYLRHQIYKYRVALRHDRLERRYDVRDLYHR